MRSRFENIRYDLPRPEKMQSSTSVSTLGVDAPLLRQTCLNMLHWPEGFNQATFLNIAKFVIVSCKPAASMAGLLIVPHSSP